MSYRGNVRMNETLHRPLSSPFTTDSLSLSKSNGYIFKTAPSLSLLIAVSLLRLLLKSTSNIKRVINHFNETTTWAQFLPTVCVMTKVTLSAVAVFQARLSHCWLVARLKMSVARMGKEGRKWGPAFQEPRRAANGVFGWSIQHVWVQYVCVHVWVIQHHLLGQGLIWGYSNAL